MLGVLVVAAVTLSAAAQVADARLRLQSSVDMAAIGANQTLRGLNSGFPCVRAKEILTLNMVLLQKCSIVGDETTVVAGITVMGIVLSATATAAAPSDGK
jgi:hypothetical protein